MTIFPTEIRVKKFFAYFLSRGLQTTYFCLRTLVTGWTSNGKTARDAVALGLGLGTDVPRVYKREGRRRKCYLIPKQTWRDRYLMVWVTSKESENVPESFFCNSKQFPDHLVYQNFIVGDPELSRQFVGFTSTAVVMLISYKKKTLTRDISPGILLV